MLRSVLTPAKLDFQFGFAPIMTLKNHPKALRLLFFQSGSGPIMTRGRRCAGEPAGDLSIRLQSDYDLRAARSLRGPSVSFNPSSVRLRPAAAMRFRPPLLHFQSVLGPITTTRRTSPTCPTSPAFNPSSVRLRHVRVQAVVRATIGLFGFQSVLGPITTFVGFFERAVTDFQSVLGPITTPRRKTRRPRPSPLSIRPRSDYDPPFDTESACRRPLFQSVLGPITTALRDSVQQGLFSFNPSSVRLRLEGFNDRADATFWRDRALENEAQMRVERADEREDAEMTKLRRLGDRLAPDRTQTGREAREDARDRYGVGEETEAATPKGGSSSGGSD